ncbi:MAG TPA: pyridoxal phosphate-dependent aminotransferase [Solirubrobacteraceae bacterium]|nr:pyridoxal phosphate-dependent aminotransferase [Solirubrobacteraceae bacterium]
MSITNLVSPSATLAVNERIRRLIDAGQPILHLAFGEAGLPVPDEVVDALTRGAPDNGYGPVAGSPRARTAAAGWFDRRRLRTDPDQVVIAPGSKALLWALLAVLPGDVVLPQPSWVSYAAQAALAGKRVWGVPIAADGPGGVPDPTALEETLAAAARQGHRPGVIVLTLPDNPTGTVPDADHVHRTVEIAEAHGLSIVSDEIYRDLAHEPGAVHSPAEYLPERTYVTSGLSKNMALGGWRIGFVRVPEGAAGRAAREAMVGLASEVWSSAPAPMQHVAGHVLNEPPEVVAHIDRSRRLHRATTLAAHGRLAAAGIRCRPPTGGFYLYPDFEPMRPQLAGQRVDGGDALAEHLLEQYGIGVLSGVAFGDEPSALRCRIATSLLYGESDDQRRQALAAGDPLQLPWIKSSLDRLGEAVAAIGTDQAASPNAA